jgi:hypothetical protein
VFAEYAANTPWIAVHLGQFAGMALLVAGLLVLFAALDGPIGAAGWAGRFGVQAAVVSLALYGVLQAVDGVALKHAVDAWAAAPVAEKAARFASAEAVRWLEWALRSYHSFVLGLTLVLFGAAVARARRAPRPAGYLMGLSGLAYGVQGWVIGTEGFSPTNAAPQLAGYALVVAWSAWLFVAALRAGSDPRTSG